MKDDLRLASSYLIRGIFRTCISFVRIFQSNRWPKISSLIQSFTCFLIRSDARFGFCSESRLYFVFDKSELSVKHYFADQKRGFDIYRFGLKKRLLEVGKSYFVNLVDFRPGDLVIDCGANYGDLFSYLKKQGIDVSYIAFEPGPEEFSVLKKNVNSGKIFETALSNREGTSRFFLNSSSADSSLIEPVASSGHIDVVVSTLTKVFSDLELQGCRLLKLEAEGFEPEILEGARQVINKIDYITFDGGPERGIHQEKTFSDVSNFLFTEGFIMIDIYGPQYRALFRNSRHVSTDE
jgi:FkbM family methyltransferase